MAGGWLVAGNGKVIGFDSYSHSYSYKDSYSHGDSYSDSYSNSYSYSDSY